MNGKTMLNGVPYFSDTQVIELTRAEYDALPNSKYTDGVLYCIKDEGVMKGDTFSPIIYSLAEREVGVWVNGKPMYQKTIFGGAITNTSLNTLWYGEDVDTICSWKCMWSDDGTWWYNADYYFTSGQQVRCFMDANHTTVPSGRGIVFQKGNSQNVCATRLTVQYTKTTDNPGTGKWTTSGVPAHHYSTEEQVIGTWIDGKTLYEKSFEFTSFVSGDNSFAHNIANLKEVIKADATINYNGATNYMLYHNPDVTTRDKIEITWVSDTTIRLNIGSNYTPYLSNMKFHVILQYTKTS